MGVRNRIVHARLLLGPLLIVALVTVDPAVAGADVGRDGEITPAPLAPLDVMEPYVSLYGQKTDVLVGSEIILILSTVNPITSPGDLTIQLTLHIPSGWSVTSSKFSSSAAGLPTAVYDIEPGTARHISVHILANEPHEGEVIGYIDYYFATQREATHHKERRLPVRAREKTSLEKAVPPPTPPSSSGTPWVLLGVLLGIASAVGYVVNELRGSTRVRG